jgi:outer membrane biosynthesis protein TonB
MAAPLQLWQHPQPKRLWPILGGLSVLVHIGVLGLSLPHVLTFVQMANPAASSAIPIELVAETSTERSTETSTETPAETAESTATSSSNSASATATTATSSPLDSAKSATEAPVFSEGDVAIVRPSRRPAPQATPTARPSPQPPRPPSTPRPPRANPSPSSPGRNAAVPPAPVDNPTPVPPAEPAQGSQPSAPSDPVPSEPPDETGSGNDGDTVTEPNGSDNGETGDDDLPVVGGNRDLPEPSEGSAASQSVSLSLSNVREIPPELRRDVVDQAPQLLSAASVALNVGDLGCGSLNFSQPSLTYSLTVDINGSVQTASLWADGGSPAPNAEESAIACLIKNAGLEFEPAQFEGEPLMGNILVTVNIAEL